MSSFLFTSESVGAGHPDKLSDQISDAVLDALIRETGKRGLRTDKIRCACETMTKTGVVIVSGEVRSEVMIDIEGIVRRTVKEVGYDRPSLGFDGDECAVVNIVGMQSSDIAQGVDRRKKVGAGDQGLMFGYACRETPSLMPMPIDLAHRLMRQHAKVRARKLPWLGPDAKSQVSVRYENGKPAGVEAIVLSSQHDEKIDGRRVGDNDKRIRKAILEHIIRPVIRKLPPDSRIHINPTGRFVIGGPKADCGLTGRKIVVDTYGGSAPHGGGAFSGKDPTKVDRSAAYMMRYVAKNIVAAGLADKCLVQTAYAIGVAEPVSLMVQTYGTHKKMTEAQIEKRIRRVFDLTPAGLIRDLDLWQPIYRKTSAYGHFGREESDFSWERTDRVDDLLG